MSADNWSHCPYCIAALRAEKDVELAGIKASYGKIPAEQYEAERAAYVPFDPSKAVETVREDYEIYLVGGWDADTATPNGVVSYSAHCQECGAGVDFEHTFTLAKGNK